VIGVTGTAGKTTVKEVLAAVLGQRGRTAKNQRNLNNRIGLPVSMLAADGNEAFWVMEVGISHAQDMDELGPILEPDLALILNAGSGHTAGLGRSVARHKARLLSWLAPGGTGLVCADYPELVREARAVRPAPAYLEFFTASGKPLAYSGGYLGAAEREGYGRYRVCRDTICRDLDAPFRGNYGSENVMAVSAVAFEFDLGMDEIAAGLGAAVLPGQRFACSRCGDWLLVDDSYNANPLSCACMLESAAGLAADMARTVQAEVPLVCVLGEMLELGDLAEEEHEKLGRHIAACGPRLVIWKGGQAAAVRYGLHVAGCAGAFVALEQAGDLPGILEEQDVRGGVILFKGSRGNRLEECVAKFKTLAETSDAV
jgi:UDP-N-acetylmuramoyl-tripeptide--D-alanyl-D-alanine ligase